MSNSSNAIPAVRATTERGHRPARVFVAASSQEDAARWISALGGDRFEVHQRADEFNSEKPPEVIVTDRSLASVEFSAFCGSMIGGNVGVVLIGRNLPADVVLPQDCSPRELRLACRLLANVVALRKQNRRLGRLASLDPLTGLANRRALEEEFDRVNSETGTRRGGCVALAMFDLDRFKNINAELGHLRGDEVLKKTAATLQARAKRHFVARLGGDEFVLLSDFACTSDASQLADEIRRAMGLAASLAIERPFSCSAGVATMDSPDTLASLLTSADDALRRAKEAGGKRTEVHD